MKAHELFKLLDPAIVAELFTTFREEEREIYKSTVNSLAQARKLRPVYVQKKPVVEQIAWMHKTLNLRGSDMIGEHLLQVWFMKFQQPLLIKFCDGMEIDHNGEGSVEGELPSELDEAKLCSTIETLFGDFKVRWINWRRESGRSAMGRFPRSEAGVSYRGISWTKTRCFSTF